MNNHFGIVNEKAFRLIALSFQGYLNCVKLNDMQWAERHKDTIEQVCKDVMPYGSGLDADIMLDYDASKPEKLVFTGVNFHHMNDGGYYDGWTEHNVIITPSLVDDFNMRITGKDRNDIKDYLAELMNDALNMTLVWSQSEARYISTQYIGYSVQLGCAKLAGVTEY